MFSFHYLNDAPLIHVDDHPELAGNVNGPSLIVAPDWLPDPPGRYLLYFAHHEGHSIRMAASDRLTGPWRLLAPPLTLEQSLFAVHRPPATDWHEEARKDIENDADGDYPHIASPDVWVDHENRQVRLYYHGRLSDCRQRSRVAISRDAVNFSARAQVIAPSYLRVFRHEGWFYAIAMPGLLLRSRDGLNEFIAGPRLTDEAIRHHAVLKHDGCWYVFWTRVGDSPERILVSRLNTHSDWSDWSLGQAREVHRAQHPWEGADEEPLASQYGAVMRRENQLRDPAIFVEDGRIFLLYAIAGEQGIAIGELKKT